MILLPLTFKSYDHIIIVRKLGKYINESLYIYISLIIIVYIDRYIIKLILFEIIIE
jgi:hypothetical protein